MKRTMLAVCVVTVLAAALAAAQGVNVPLVGTELGVSAGVTAQVEQVMDADGGQPALKVTFSKKGDERRLLAVDTQPQGSPVGAKALVLRYQLTLTKGEAPRPALVVFGQDGGSWYKVAGRPLEVGGFTEARVSLANMRPTAFSPNTGALDWSKVTRIWVGGVLDGLAEGSVQVSDARLTDEPYKPAKPVRLLGEGPGTWTASQDPAVQGKVGTPAEGPEGQACMKYEFVVPAGRHMYAIPTAGLTPGEREGFTAVRFRYKARVPEGMRMLVTLGEGNGSCYFVEPPGPWAADWTEMVLPLTRFQWASWSPKDPAGHLAQEDIASIMVGCHGVPKEGGPGLMMVTDIELLP